MNTVCNLCAKSLAQRVCALAIVLASLLLCAPAYAADDLAYYNLRTNMFVSNAKWKDTSSWNANQGSKYAPKANTGCAAYAADFVAYVYGLPSLFSGTSWNGSATQIKSGDILGLTADDATYHWIVVIERTGNTLRTAEANWQARVHIGNNYWIEGNYLKRQGFSSRFRVTEGYHHELRREGALPSIAAKEIYKEKNEALMYRLYNPNSGEHFYTANAAEGDQLVRLGWDFEGIGWMAPRLSNIPVYRLYNPNAGDHHYTSSAAEKNMLVAVGWRYEGIGWYSDEYQRMALWRQYNPNAKAGSHNYTVSKSENDMLVRLGWQAEGIGWYGYGWHGMYWGSGHMANTLTWQ